MACEKIQGKSSWQKNTLIENVGLYSENRKFKQSMIQMGLAIIIKNDQSDILPIMRNESIQYKIFETSD